MFDVFVSYAHEDVGLARALASGLSRVGKPWWRRRSLHVFRDETVMTASADLWDSIRGPLEDSAWFVSIISPAAAASPWVAREIDWWVTNRGDDHLLVVLADGTCDWDPDHNDWSPTATAVPPPLRGAFDGEPRWVDATWTATHPDLTRRDGRFLDLLAELAAPVQHTTKDAIVGEELKQHRRTVRTVTAAATLLFLLAVAAIIGAVVALDQRDQAEHRRQQALSQSLAGQAAELATSRPDLGILLAVEAWNHANTPQAEQALITAAQSEGLLPRVLSRSTPAPHGRVPERRPLVRDPPRRRHGRHLEGGQHRPRHTRPDCARRSSRCSSRPGPRCTDCRAREPSTNSTRRWARSRVSGHCRRVLVGPRSVRRTRGTSWPSATSEDSSASGRPPRTSRSGRPWRRTARA